LPEKNPNRVSLILAFAIVGVSLIWIGVSKFAITALIDSAYHGQSWPILNKMITGQSSHPLAEYLSAWERVSRVMLLALFAAGLLVVAFVRAYLPDYSSVRGRGLRALALHPRLPALVSLTLLVFQVGLIWFGGGIPTQDGSSHAYNALVLRELLFHSGSAFRRPYALNSYPTSNWVSSLLISLGNMLAGPSHAEQVLATIAILSLFAAMYYAQRALSPKRALLWPVLNALLNVWFLWTGFYSFYLGMAVSLFCVGYYIRHLRHMATRHYVWLGTAMMILYFTHPMAQVLTGVVLSVVCIWDVLYPADESTQAGQLSCRLRSTLRSYVLLLVSMVPSAIFLLIFMRQEKLVQAPSAFSWKELGLRLSFFPVDLFRVERSELFLSVSDVLCAGILFAIFASVVLWKRADWRGTQGGLFAAVVIMFGIYLFTPERSGDAGYIKERIAWAILIFSIVTASASVRSRITLRMLALFLAPFVAVNLYLTDATAWSATRARAYYAPLEQAIRPGSSFLRLNYPADEFEKRYDLPALKYDPMLHAAELVALQKSCLSWSNYEAVSSQAFPVVFRLSQAEKKLLSLFENRNDKKAEALQWFLAGPGNRVEYIAVYGELPKPGNVNADRDLADDFRDVLELLTRKYDLIATSGEGPVLRLYQRKR
jgi:hypothetical protein